MRKLRSLNSLILKIYFNAFQKVSQVCSLLRNSILKKQFLYLYINMQSDSQPNSPCISDTCFSESQQHEDIEGEYEAVELQPLQKILLGICAMRKKVESKPMREILKRISCQNIQIVEMWQFLDKDPNDWPKVHALICFYSDGFPFLKAWKYVKKTKPFLINNLQKQELLWDRSAVYDILKKLHIPVAKHYFVFRNLDYIDQIEKKTFPQADMNQLIDTPKADSPNTGFNEGTNKIFIPQTSTSRRKKDESHQKKKIIARKHSLNPLLSLHMHGHGHHQKTKSKEKDDKIFKQYDLKYTKMILSNQVRPYYLRQFHQKRLNKIEQYEIQEIDDCLHFKTGQTTQILKKPFVEKPFDAQNHSICIYYPESMGGGRKMLFRKVKNQCSKYEEGQNHIRRDGNYIYEQFLPTNAFDIKVYTIGCYYMYAEARKSPTLDGVVQRDENGKEKRFPIILTPQEKFIANKIVQQFGQQVCGFDMLRANGRSYVCDVNGWSFVKNNYAYWDDCAVILKKKIYSKFYPDLHNQHHFSQKFKKDINNGVTPPVIEVQQKKQELRSIVSIYRHGDRSPKEKLKFKTDEPKILAFFEEHAKFNESQIKVKNPKNLQELLQVVNSIIAEANGLKNNDLVLLCQMKSVLESGGHFEGLNRKCQLKVEKRNQDGVVKKLRVVVKWGGQLSLKGCRDAIELGKRMRMQKYSDSQDLLSLHSSYRHDLKTYSSDEGRCIKTAASFLKGLLNIEGGLAPIITSLVNTNKKAQNLLDCTSEQNHSQLSEKIVNEISQMLNSENLLIDSYLKFIKEEEIAPEMLRIINQIGRPLEKLKQIREIIFKLVIELQEVEIQKRINEDRNSRVSGGSFEEDETEDILLIYKRWSKLHKELFNSEQNKYNISKIPDIYDTIRHDLYKNSYVFSQIDLDKEKFLELSSTLAHFVVPNQYGITKQQKILTAQDIVSPLLDKVIIDLNFWRERQYEDLYWKYMDENEEESWKHIRSRLYFTSASHMYSILHLMTLGNDSELLKDLSKENVDKIRSYVYMSYLSHIQFRLYENFGVDSEDINRFRVEITISSEYSKNSEIQEISFGNKGFTIDKIKNFLKNIIRADHPKTNDQ